jgi:hypothetical protein
MSQKIESMKFGLAKALGKGKQAAARQQRTWQKVQVLKRDTDKWQHELENPKKWEFHWGPASNN